MDPNSLSPEFAQAYSEIQQQFGEIKRQAELAERGREAGRFSGSDPDGIVTVVVNGKGELTDVRFDPRMLRLPKRMWGGRIVAAADQARVAAGENAQEVMRSFLRPDPES